MPYNLIIGENGLDPLVLSGADLLPYNLCTHVCVCVLIYSIINGYAWEYIIQKACKHMDLLISCSDCQTVNHSGSS